MKSITLWRISFGIALAVGGCNLFQIIGWAVVLCIVEMFVECAST